jgi:hypothetical protein
LQTRDDAGRVCLGRQAAVALGRQPLRMRWHHLALLVPAPHAEGITDVHHNRQSIDVDRELAKTTPFRTTIAPGFLTVSMLTHSDAGADLRSRTGPERGRAHEDQRRAKPAFVAESSDQNRLRLTAAEGPAGPALGLGPERLADETEQLRVAVGLDAALR